MPSVTLIASSAISLAESCVRDARGARRRHRERRARADRHDAVVGLHQVAVARKEEDVVLVGDEQQGVQMAEHPVRPPVLGELHARPFQVPPMRLELRLELREQRLGIGGGSGETGEDRSVAHAPQLARPVFHHDVPEGDLPVGGQGRTPAAADSQHGRGVERGRHGTDAEPPRTWTIAKPRAQPVDTRAPRAVFHTGQSGSIAVPGGL